MTQETVTDTPIPKQKCPCPNWEADTCPCMECSEEYTKEEWSNRKLTGQGLIQIGIDLIIMPLVLLGLFGALSLAVNTQGLGPAFCMYIAVVLLLYGVFFRYFTQLVHPRDYYQTEITYKKKDGTTVVSRHSRYS